MIIRNGAVLLGVANPDSITKCLPTAKVLNIKNHKIVAVKHTLDYARVLNNLGLKVPPPLLYDGYKFTGRWAPMAHQVQTAEFLLLNNKAFVLSEMGTGKTGAALWALDYLMKRNHIKKVLVICPLSVIGVWINEAFTFTPHLSISQLIGKKEKRIEILSKESQIAVINFDGAVVIEKQLENWRPDLVIVDEASAYCNAKTQRYKALQSILRPTTRLWLMTGTPIATKPTDSFGLIKLVSPNNVPRSFKIFNEMLMRQVGPYKWVPKDGAKDIVNRLMQPACRFTKEECLDLPEITFNYRHCEMSKEQKTAFDSIRLKMRHEDEENGVSIVATNAAIRVIKLQQILAGVVKDDNGGPVYLNPKDRLNVVNEIIKESNGKVIIAVPFIYSMEMILSYLTKSHAVELVNGRTPKNKRDEIFSRFQNSNDIDVLIVHPKVAAHGLTLTAASTIIWYGPIFSNEQYEQLNKRIDRKGQKNVMTIVHLYSHPFEKRIYNLLQARINMQSELLALYAAALDTGGGAA